ncbi:DMT family transporter [Cellulomonas sp. PhB150]|uniref:EamA family transporter n=1 Tax=Cellulomonas sp. PhB150 TaxID=2485188 RepID=UPI000F483C74|nr:EamA family transporter [Cellulomonas sp. PhB150]ROS26049.1 inner membrane transporter RhtA [Cellulomonas sp. PhB150]
MPAPLLFVLSGLAQYAGAALAVGLFATLAAPTVAWLRILVAAVVLVVWRRPWRTRWTRRDLGTVLLFGVVLAAMNVSFYVAIDHLPLGTAVAIEFAGPVAVAALTGHGWRDRVAIGVAAVGVVLLAGVSLDGGADARTGLVAALLAAALWAGYILLGRRVATAASGGVTGLAVAMTAGALAFAPFLAAGAAPVLDDPALLVAVVGVGVLSSVIPYAIEQVVLRRMRPATFAVLLALLPATAAVVGAVALHQVPHGLEVVGLLLVSGAIALTARASDAPDEAPPPA